MIRVLGVLAGSRYPARYFPLGITEYFAGIPMGWYSVPSYGMSDPQVHGRPVVPARSARRRVASSLGFQPHDRRRARPRSLRKRVWLVTRIIRLGLMMAARVQIFVRVEKAGSRNVPRQGRVILAGNHPSPIDAILLFGGLRRNVCFLAAEFLFRQPVLGRLLRWMGHIRVERGTDKALEAAAFGEHVLAHDGVVVIFPSGRITKPGERYQPKTGVARMAFATGSPIVPFHLSGTERIFAGGRPRLMRRVHMVFGEPIAVAQVENPTRADLVTLTSRVVSASDRLALS
jgi:1-acyl-sn-glycerol-3-phosphate acyltransferase